MMMEEECFSSAEGPFDAQSSVCDWLTYTTDLGTQFASWIQGLPNSERTGIPEEEQVLFGALC